MRILMAVLGGIFLAWVYTYLFGYSRIMKSTDLMGNVRCVEADLDGNFVMWAPNPDGSCSR